MAPLTLLFVTLFNSILGLSVLFPVLAPLGRTLGLSEFEIGSLTGAYALMQLVFSPFWGRLSERRGRKPIMLMGILGFSVSFFGFAVAAEVGRRHLVPHLGLYLMLLGARLVGGIFSSATLPTAQAYVADVTDRDSRTRGMALIGAAFGLAVIFGPVIGAALSTIGLLAPVYASAGLALLNALFVWWRLPEPVRQRSETPVAALSLADRRITHLLAAGLTATLASVAMEQTIAFYFQDQLGLTEAMTPRYVGAALAVYGIVSVAAQVVLIRRLRLGAPALLRLGPPIALAGFVLLLVARRFGVLTSALALQGLGQGLILPGVTSALSLSVDDNEQGPVAGLNSASQAFARMLGPFVGAGLYQLNRHYPYAFSSILLAGLTPLLWLRLRAAGRTAP
jgi:MFS family permease